MSEILKLSCLGMKCPRPIIEIAKAERKQPTGSLICVEADDLAFGSDVRAWCDTTKSTLLSLKEDGPCFVATIRLEG